MVIGLPPHRFRELSFMAQPGVSPQRLLRRCGIPNMRRPWVMKCTPASSTPARCSSIKRLQLILNRRAISVEVSHSQVVVMADKEITARPKGLQYWIVISLYALVGVCSAGRPTCNAMQAPIAAMLKMASRPDALPHASTSSGRQAIAVRVLRTIEHLSTPFRRLFGFPVLDCSSISRA